MPMVLLEPEGYVRIQIVIDGEQFAITPTRVEHLIEFLRIVRNQYQSQDRFIRSMTLNGQELNDLSVGFIQKLWNASQEMSITIATADSMNTVLHTIDHLYHFLTKLKYDVVMCSEYFHTQSFEDAERSWVFSLEGIEWVLEKLKEIEDYFFRRHRSIPQTTSSPMRAIADDITVLVHHITTLYYKEDYEMLAQIMETDLCQKLETLQHVLEGVQTYKLSA